MTPFALFRTSAFATALVFAASAGWAQACPDWRPGGQVVSTDADTAWVPQSYATTAGGPLNLGACSTVQGVGQVTSAPTFTLTYDDRGMGRDLDFRVDAQNCDTTILINDATAQWHFNDDSDNSLNGRVRLPAAPSGRYDVWVGTFGPSTCAANLVVETFPPSGTAGTGPAQSQCPEWSIGGAELRVAAGGAESQSVVAGGGVNLFERAQGCGIQGHGYVAQGPDFTLYYDAPDANAELILSASGDCDTVLLVNDLNAAWLFNDDTDGFNPQVTVPAAASGRYDIWVGTYGPSLCQASLSVVSVLPAPPAPQPGLSK